MLYNSFTTLMVFAVPKRQRNKKGRVIAYLLLLGLILTGIFIYKDYGISWDEPTQRKYGLDTYNYILRKDQKLLKNNEKYYGPVFEVLLVALEEGLNLTDTQDIYYMRHLFNFYIFLAGTIFFYLLCKKILGSWQLGLLGSLMLVINPRIFAHGFYNSKDIPLMVFFIISFYTATCFYKSPNIKTALAHGLATALTIDTRILGVLIPILTVIGFIANKKLNRHDFRALRVYFISMGILTIAFWPTLWQNPIQNFIAAFEQMSKYPQSTSTLTLGKSLKSTSLPWYYIPVWIAVTTPITYLLTFLLGIITVIKKPIAAIRKNLLPILGWIFVPLAMVILFKSTLYNAWRQLFFIYPGILIIGLYGLTRLKGKVLLLVTLILAANITYTSWKMIQLHPYQTVYFNKLAQKEKFEQDYWGLSYKEALEYILQTDKRGHINVRVENFPGVNNHMILPKEKRNRLTVKETLDTADYFLTNRPRNEEPDFTIDSLGTTLLRGYIITKPTSSNPE